MKTTKEELAARLHGVEIGDECADRQIIADAKESNLLIVYGASDDLCEFEGAFSEEVDCYEGGTIRFTRAGKCPDEEILRQALETLNDALGFTPALPELLTVEAVWDDEAPDGRQPSWHYKTTLPHATFDVMEDGELYCIGLVIDLSEQPNAEEAP